jgi:hypothetical protein
LCSNKFTNKSNGNKIDLVIIQELSLNADLFYRSIIRPKTAILVPNSQIQSVFINQFSNEYLTTIDIELMQKSIIIFSLYLSPFDDINIGLNFLQTINTSY